MFAQCDIMGTLQGLDSRQIQVLNCTNEEKPITDFSRHGIITSSLLHLLESTRKLYYEF